MTSKIETIRLPRNWSAHPYTTLATMPGPSMLPIRAIPISMTRITTARAIYIMNEPVLDADISPGDWK